MRGLLLLLLALISVSASAQFNKDLDKINGLGVGTRYRDDVLWSNESAGIVPKRKANVSLCTPTRYGIARDWELSTSIVGDVFRPKIEAKNQFHSSSHTWYFAHKMGLATAYTGLKIAQNNGATSIVDSVATIPLVGEASYEIMASHVYRTDLNCSDGSPWLILTFSLTNYVGFPIDGSDDLPQIRRHFLANRGESLTKGWGYVGRLKIWVDALVQDWLYVRGGTFFYSGTFKKSFAFELHAFGEFMITPRFSASAGAMLSAANYRDVDKKVSVLPMVDLTCYIGHKARKTSLLFDPSGRKY